MSDIPLKRVKHIQDIIDERDALRKRVEELESTLRFMSGLLSTYGHWAGMHPQEVMGEVLKMSAEIPEVVKDE